MAKKLLILDKDGTIVKTRSGRPFVNRPWDQELIAGAASMIEQYQSNGWKVAIVSNQAGVQHGYKSLESAIMEMQYCLELLPDSRGVNAFFCPDEGESCCRVWGECEAENRIIYGSSHSLSIELDIVGQYRKPGAGMFRLACDVEGVYDYANVLMIGDRPEDQQASIAAKIQFMDAEAWRLGRL